MKIESKSLWIAGSLAFTSIMGSFYIISQGRTLEGVAATPGTLATLAGVFIYGKRQRRQDSAQSRDQAQDSHEDFPKILPPED